MKKSKKGSRQGGGRVRRSRSSDGGSVSNSNSRRAKIRKANAVSSTSDASNGNNSSTPKKSRKEIIKATKEAAHSALREIGISVSPDGKIDTNAVKKMAEGATVAAAKSLGVNVMRADGSLDENKIREAVAKVVGLSVVNGENAVTGELMKMTTEMTLKVADSMGVDIRNEIGDIDSNKIALMAEAALDFSKATKIKLNRQETLKEMEKAFDQLDGIPEIDRRSAKNAVEKLLGSSVLVNGQIDGRKALEARDKAIELAKKSDTVVWKPPQIERSAAQRNLLAQKAAIIGGHRK